MKLLADFESILVPEDSGKKNSDESYTNKYQKHVGCSYGYKIVCVCVCLRVCACVCVFVFVCVGVCFGDEFSKPFNSSLGRYIICNFISSMITESKYCSKRCNKMHFNKELVMTTDDNSINCCICDNEYVDGDFQVKYHCHTTGKYRGSPHRHCNIKIKLNYKIEVVSTTLKILIHVLL